MCVLKTHGHIENQQQPKSRFLKNTAVVSSCIYVSLIFLSTTLSFFMNFYIIIYSNVFIGLMTYLNVINTAHGDVFSNKNLPFFICFYMFVAIVIHGNNNDKNLKTNVLVL